MMHLIKGGRIIDPSQNIDEKLDLLIRGGKILKAGRNLDEALANFPDTTPVDLDILDPGVNDTDSSAKRLAGEVAVELHPAQRQRGLAFAQQANRLAVAAEEIPGDLALNQVRRELHAQLLFHHLDDRRRKQARALVVLLLAVQILRLIQEHVHGDLAFRRQMLEGDLAGSAGWPADDDGHGLAAAERPQPYGRGARRPDGTRLQHQMPRQQAARPTSPTRG